MYFCLTLTLGLISPFLLNVDFLPETKDRFIIVNANYQGARAKEIRRLITIPLEENLSSLKGIKNIESVSRDGRSTLKIELRWNTNFENALLETKSILDSSNEYLPQDCPKPTAQKAMESDDKAIKIIVWPNDEKKDGANTFVKNDLKRKILSLKETAYVKNIGLSEPEIQVIVDSKASAHYGLSLEEIAQAISMSNFDYPAGMIQDGENNLLLKTEGTFRTFFDIMETNLKTNKGPLKLIHLARVEKACKNHESFCFYNGKRCAELLIFCKKNHNPLNLSKKIRKLVDELKIEKSDYSIVIENDSSDEIKKTIRALTINAFAGIAIVLFLLVVFFKSVEIALTVAAVIPFSLIFTSFVLLCFNRSINIISISGMTICLGMIIDNCIVAIESAMEEKPKKNWAIFIEQAFIKIEKSNTASTITSAIVFLPLFFIEGLIGELFLDLAISVISGLILSLLYSFTVLPAICVLFLQKNLINSKTFDFSWLEKKRQKILQKSDKIKRLCPALSIFFMIFTALLFIPIKKEFQPKTKDAYAMARIFFPNGTSLELIQSQAKMISSCVKGIPKVENVFCWGGNEKEDLDFYSNAENKKECINLKAYSSDLKNTKKKMKKIFEQLGLNYSMPECKDIISQRLQISNNFLFMQDDEDKLFDESNRLFGKDNFFPNEISEQKTFVENKELMKKLKITPNFLAKNIKSALNGSPASSFYENGVEIPIVVRFEKKEFSAENKLDSLNVILGQSPIQLSSLGKWKIQAEESLLYRNNGKDAKIVDKNAGKKNLKKIAGRLVSMQGENLKSLFFEGTLLLLLVLALLYCILGAQTESLCQPLYYLTAVPPSFFGAALSLLVFGSSLNINSIIAFMLLFGTSVNNSIILSESGGKKTSTVFITSATSMACLLPFAFDPFRTNPQSSLSLAVAGGLAFSTAAVLIMTPNILHWSKK